MYEFGALASNKITNTVSTTENTRTVVQGKVGVANGNVTGFGTGAGEGVAVRGVHQSDALAKQAVTDALAAIAYIDGLQASGTIPSGSLNGVTITPGVHDINGSATLGDGAILKLDGGSVSNPVFIIRVKGDLTVGQVEKYELKNAVGINLYWLVDGNVTINSGGSARGNIFTKGNVTMKYGARLRGRIAAPSQGANIDIENITLNHPADLATTLTMLPSASGDDKYAFGEKLTYIVKVRNNGPVNAPNVKVPLGQLIGTRTGYSSSMPERTSYDASSSTIIVSELKYQEEVTITIEAHADQAGPWTSLVKATWQDLDEVGANDTGLVDFCVLLSETSEISGPTEVCRGDVLTFRIERVAGATYYEWTASNGLELRVLGTESDALAVEVTVSRNQDFPGSSAWITVTPGNNCGPGPSRTINLTIQSDVPNQPGPITGPDAICQGLEEATFSIAPVANATSYNWVIPNGWQFISGQGTTEIVVRPGDNSGNVQVHAVNACGSSEPQTKYVQVDDQSPLAPSEIIGTIQGCVDTTVPYEVPAVPTATEYTWTITAPQGSGWAIVSGQGTRQVLVKVGNSPADIAVVAKNGCGVSEPVTKHVEPVSSPSPAPGAITGDVNTCINQTGLKYSVEPVPNATRYEWTVPAGWEIVSGQGTSSIIVNAKANGGDITVVAWNDCGPSDPSRLTVVPADDVPLQPGPISGSQYGCVGGTTTYSIDPITGANSYTWTVPTGWTIISGQGTTSIEVQTGANSGKVTVSAVNGCGTGASSELNVVPQTEPPLPPAPIHGPREVCEGQAGYEFSVEPIAGVNTYTWTVPAGWIITAGQGTSKITVTAGDTAGEVTVKGENDCGEGTAAAITVTVVPSPPEQPGAISGPPSVCVGQKQVTYSIEPVAFATNYIWSVGNGAGWEIVSGQGTTSIVVNAGSAPTIISVRAQNACGVTGESQLTAIMTSEVPAMPGPITGNTVTCAGGTYTFSIDPVEGAYQYNWSFPAGWQVVENKGTTVSVITNGTGGTVSVTAENGCGPGGAQTLQVTPTNAAPATPAAILGNLDVCKGTEATFYVEEISNASGYFWQVPTGWTIISGQGTASIKVLVGNNAGTISVTSKNDCGDSDTISRDLILNTAPPATPGVITGSAQVCASTTATYTIAPVNTAFTYTWTVPTGWEIISGQGTQTIEVKVGTSGGEVTVLAGNSCGVSGLAKLAVDVADNTPIAPGEITGPATTFCEGATGLTYSIQPVDGATAYEWTVPAGWNITAGQGTTSITVTAGAEPGEVTVTAVNACGNGGTARKSVVSQTAPLTPEITVGPINPCQGVTTTYSVSASATGNVDTYLWEVPEDWVIVSGQNTSTIEVIANGTAGKIKVTAKNSCQVSGTAELDVVPSPALPATPSGIVGTPEVCAGTTVTFSVPNPSVGAAYEWTVPEGWQIVSGQGKAEITVITGPGAGTITVKGTNGCGTTEPASLNVAAMPAEGVTSIRDLSTPCVGLSYEVDPVPGATTYTWTVPAGWSIVSGQGTTRITVTAGFGNGSISVVASNGGCADEPVYHTPDPTFANSELHFPNVFSPNNDGTHDTWEIRNILNYPDNEVTIINRWGNQVYHSKSYKNSWDGDNLSEGTYFYVVRVKLCDGQDKMFKGYVMIVR
ncbi:gliding motility-associated C-terminal domain-containing protein [Pontibacter mucosus]